METKGGQFQKIVESLPGLSEEELLDLEKLFWDLKAPIYSNTERKNQEFAAEAEFSSQASEQAFSLDAIREASGDLNPAEIKVVYTLITFHLDKAHHYDGQQVTAHWGTNGSFTREGLQIAYGKVSSAPQSDAPKKSIVIDFRKDHSAPNPQFDPESDTVKKFAEYSKLLSEAGAAKDAGDKQRAVELAEKAIKIAEELGLPDYMLQRMREHYL